MKTVSAPPSSPPVPRPAMLTVTLTLETAQQLGVALPWAEWDKLVAGFSAMPAPMRGQFSASLRASVAHIPLPAEQRQLSLAEQQTCDAFISDCLLLAALAEAMGERALLDTPISTYVVQRGNGLPKPAMHA